MIKYKYRHRKKIIAVIGVTLSILAVTFTYNKLKPVNVFEIPKGEIRVTTSQRMALINVEPDDELKQEVFDSWDKLNWGDRALYAYRLNMGQDAWAFVNEKFDENENINKQINRMVNSILAVESLFKRFLIVDDAYVLADKLDAVNYYCDNIDDAYKELKDLGYNNGDFESARLNWLNKTYPALQQGLADSHSTFKKEGAYNNFTSQLYYWEKILYGE